MLTVIWMVFVLFVSSLTTAFSAEEEAMAFQLQNGVIEIEVIRAEASTDH